MKQKYSKCENCGANEYETDKRKPFIKCSYCGTEYEVNDPKPIAPHRQIAFGIPLTCAMPYSYEIIKHKC